MAAQSSTKEAIKRQGYEEDEPEELVEFYVKEPQFHPEFGKMLPGDKVMLPASLAARYQRLGILYKDGEKHEGKSLRERIEEAEAEARERVLAEAAMMSQPVMLGGKVRPENEAAQAETDRREEAALELLNEQEREAKRRTSGPRRAAVMSDERARQRAYLNQAGGEAARATADMEAERAEKE